MRTLKSYPFRKFQVYNTILITVVAMMHVRASRTYQSCITETVTHATHFLFPESLATAIVLSGGLF